jgi:hypothetical protein
MPPATWLSGGSRGHVDNDAAAYGRLGSGQSRHDVILEPRAHQLSDAIKVFWLLVPQDAECPALVGKDILESAEPGVL